MRRYLEFAVVVSVIAILAATAMYALDHARGQAEESGLQMEVMAIRAQLMEVAVHRETFGGGLPSSNNPIDWIATRPANYLGVLADAPETGGRWYFHSQSGELVYRFHDGHLARFRLSREAGRSDGRGMPAGIGLLRLPDQRQ